MGNSTLWLSPFPDPILTLAEMMGAASIVAARLVFERHDTALPTVTGVGAYRGDGTGVTGVRVFPGHSVSVRSLVESRGPGFDEHLGLRH